MLDEFMSVITRYELDKEESMSLILSNPDYYKLDVSFVAMMCGVVMASGAILGVINKREEGKK